MMHLPVAAVLGKTASDSQIKGVFHTMKIALFGATGGTGREIVRQALEQGYTVSALVRDPARLGISDANLTLSIGDVLDPAAVASVVEGADVAIISLGNTPNNPDFIVSEGTAVILDAMREAGVARVIAITSLGVGESKDQVPLAFRMLMRTVMKRPMEDKERQERLVKESGLDWIIIRPGGLTNGSATGTYRAGTDPNIVAGQVSRADVAAFTLQQVADDTYLRQAPAIT